MSLVDSEFSIETNNTPAAALNAIAPALTGTRTRLNVAVQDRCTEIVCLR